MSGWRFALLPALLCGSLWACGSGRAPLKVGSKAFTVSLILGEIVTQTLRQSGATVKHARQLGGSRVLFEALSSGEIDAYVEYSGTLSQELLRVPAAQANDPVTLARALAPHGIQAGPRLGFDNTYALAMRRERAQALGARCISDLKAHPDLRYAIGHELLVRRDGFQGLRKRYGLLPREVRAMEHSLAYRAIEGEVDVIDVYTTDAEILTRDLRVLEDDRHYFPEYAALILYREAAFKRRPAALRALTGLADRIDTRTMTKLNAQATRQGGGEAQLATAWLGGQPSGHRASRWDRMRRRTLEHLVLVGVSLLAALLGALPLGIASAHRPRLARVVLGACGVLQTLPSLALLVLLIPLLGIGTAPAVGALFVYSLLPIVQNTHAGLSSIDVRLLESATVIGLTPRMRLWWVELPLALPMLVAGIKTAAVINIGTATLGALVGAGGYGQPIVTGIRLNDMQRVAEGALPACLLALVAQASFDAIERLLTSRGTRSRPIR